MVKPLPIHISVLGAALALSSLAAAQDFHLRTASETDSLTGRLDLLEADLAELQRQLYDERSTAGNYPGAYQHPCREGAFAAYEAVILKPHFEDNIALTTNDGATLTAEPFSWDYAHSPRFWLGYETASGPGVQTRYWEFHHASEVSGIASGPVSAVSTISDGSSFFTTQQTIAGQSLVAGSTLELRTFDLEVFKRIYWPVSTFTCAIGVRYGAMEQDFASYRLNGGGGIIMQLLSTHDFEGFGPTIGLDYRRPLADFGVSMIAAARVSYLLGHADQIVAGQTPGAPPQFVKSNHDETLAIGELRVGVEGFREISGDGRIFVTAALEAQTWWGAGNAGSPNGSDLGLLGVMIGAGVVR